MPFDYWNEFLIIWESVDGRGGEWTGFYDSVFT